MLFDHIFVLISLGLVCVLGGQQSTVLYKALIVRNA